jgi:hypothetical protein
LTEASANEHLTNFFRRPPTKGFYDPNVLRHSNSIEASSQRLIAMALSARSSCELDLAAVLVQKGAELAHQAADRSFALTDLAVTRQPSNNLSSDASVSSTVWSR